MKLCELKPGQSARIVTVGGEGALRQHFLDMGVIPGAEATLIKFAPMGDPMELRIHGYELTLRLSDAEKIKYTMQTVDREAFSAAVDAIVAAENVYIFGVRSSAFLAGFFNFNLSMIQDNVRLVQPTSSSEIFEQILGIGRRDVLFAISFPRYSAKVVNALKYARSREAEVIALTDSVQSPLAEHASYLLTAQSDMASFVDSLVAPLSIIDALLVAVTQRRGDEVRDRFDRLERVWDEYDVYAKS